MVRYKYGAIERVTPQPFLALPELVGAAVLLWLVYELVRRMAYTIFSIMLQYKHDIIPPALDFES